MKRIKKTIIIAPQHTFTQAQAASIADQISSDKDVAMGGDFEIWEKDLDTGRMEKLR